MPREGVEGRMPGKKQMKILALLNMAVKNRMQVDEFLEGLHEEEVLRIYRSQMRRHTLIACLALQNRGFVEVSNDETTVKLTNVGKSFLKTTEGASARATALAKSKK